MRARRVLTVIALAGVMSACATPMMFARKDGGRDADQFSRDRYRCVQESRTSWSAWGGTIAMAVAQAQAEQKSKELYLLCMDAAGYRLVTRP